MSRFKLTTKGLGLAAALAGVFSLPHSQAEAQELQRQETTRRDTIAYDYGLVQEPSVKQGEQYICVLKVPTKGPLMNMMRNLHGEPRYTTPAFCINPETHNPEEVNVNGEKVIMIMNPGYEITSQDGTILSDTTVKHFDETRRAVTFDPLQAYSALPGDRPLKASRVLIRSPNGSVPGVLFLYKGETGADVDALIRENEELWERITDTQDYINQLRSRPTTGEAGASGQPKDTVSNRARERRKRDGYIDRSLQLGMGWYAGRDEIPDFGPSANVDKHGFTVGGNILFQTPAFKLNGHGFYAPEINSTNIDGEDRDIETYFGTATLSGNNKVPVWITASRVNENTKGEEDITRTVEYAGGGVGIRGRYGELQLGAAGVHDKAYKSGTHATRRSETEEISEYWDRTDIGAVLNMGFGGADNNFTFRLVVPINTDETGLEGFGEIRARLEIFENVGITLDGYAMQRKLYTVPVNVNDLPGIIDEFNLGGSLYLNYDINWEE